MNRVLLVATIHDALVHLDPQLPGADSRAERLADAVEDRFEVYECSAPHAIASDPLPFVEL